MADQLGKCVHHATEVYNELIKSVDGGKGDPTTPCALLVLAAVIDWNLGWLIKAIEEGKE